MTRLAQSATTIHNHNILAHSDCLVLLYKRQHGCRYTCPSDTKCSQLKCTGLLLLSLGERLSAESGDSRETSFLFQENVSVVDLQRFNAGLMSESFLDA